jgi:glutathione S-transferase
LKKWEEQMAARPALERGRHVPDPHTIKETLKNPEKMKAIEESSKKWIQSGMAADAKR